MTIMRHDGNFLEPAITERAGYGFRQFWSHDTVRFLAVISAIAVGATVIANIERHQGPSQPNPVIANLVGSDHGVGTSDQRLEKMLSGALVQREKDNPHR